VTVSCRSCRAPVRWAFTVHGKRIPVDPEPVDGGNLVLHEDPNGGAPTAEVVPAGAQLLDGDDGRRYVSHFVTCPNADQHRRR
jgi:hypothetical protein